MLCRNTVLFVVSLLLVTHVTGQAQTPRAAVTLFQSGNQKLQQGDLDGAIEALTRAIEISSRLGPSTKGKRPLNTSGYSEAGEAEEALRETTGIIVIDPFTAEAYTSRGLARYLKGEMDGAIADWDQAIRIRPRHADP